MHYSKLDGGLIASCLNEIELFREYAKPKGKFSGLKFAATGQNVTNDSSYSGVLMGLRSLINKSTKSH